VTGSGYAPPTIEVGQQGVQTARTE
jgi:hypothetical protein